MREFILLMPEVFLVLTLMAVIASETTYHGERTRLVFVTVLIGLGAAFLQTVLNYEYGATQLFGKSLTIDGLSLLAKLIFITFTSLTVVIADQTSEIPFRQKAEYYCLVLAGCLAMCFAASAADMLLAFLSLLCLNIICFFLAGFHKRSGVSIEAAIKYMIFTAVAGSLILYGLAILFSATHSLNVYEIHRELMAHPPGRTPLLISFMLIFLALAFQMGAFPMYLWAPDVLEGAPTPASGFLSLAPRAAGFIVATRFLIVVFAQPGEVHGQWQTLQGFEWTQIVAFVSGISMVVGSFLAYRQTSAKRLIACLLIAESGYLLMGLLVLDEVGIAALLFNLVIELFALSGTFFILSYFIGITGSDQLKDFRGMLNRAVPEAICLILFLLCLVGLPPTPGFLGKFTLIGSAIRHRWLALGFISIVSMAVSAVAVSRLVYHLIGEPKALEKTELPNLNRKIFLTVLVMPILLVGVLGESVLNWAGKSLGFIFW